MASEEKESDSKIADYVVAVDKAVAIFWRWGTILALVIGFSLQMGVYLNKNSTQEKSFADFKYEVFKRMDRQDDKNAATAVEVKALQMAHEADQAEMRELKEYQKIQDARLVNLTQDVKVAMALKNQARQQ